MKLYSDGDFDIFHFGCFWVGGNCESEISKCAVCFVSIDPTRDSFVIVRLRDYDDTRHQYGTISPFRICGGDAIRSVFESHLPHSLLPIESSRSEEFVHVYYPT